MESNLLFVPVYAPGHEAVVHDVVEGEERTAAPAAAVEGGVAVHQLLHAQGGDPSQARRRCSVVVVITTRGGSSSVVQGSRGEASQVLCDLLLQSLLFTALCSSGDSAPSSKSGRVSGCDHRAAAGAQGDA